MTNLFLLPDRKQNYQSHIVYAIAIIWLVATTVIVSMGFYFFPHLWSRWAILFGSSIFIAAFNLSLNRFGFVNLARWSLTIMLWLYVTIPCYSAGGIFAPTISLQISIILTAGFLLGGRGGLAIGLITMVVDFGFAYMETVGYLPPPSIIYTPMTRWISALIPFGTIIPLQYYATNHLRTGLLNLQREIERREEIEKIKDQTVHNLGERVKELRTLYSISRLMQDEGIPPEKLYHKIAEVIPTGWQYPEITAARVIIAEAEYASHNYKPSEYSQQVEMKTYSGTRVFIEVVYLKQMPEYDEGPFLKEERNLIVMLAEMLKSDFERRIHKAELLDYKHALDIASIVSISQGDGTFTFVNENFCSISKYRPEELVGKPNSIIWSGFHSPEYFAELKIAMQTGKPYRGEFCNKAKDGTLYWVDTSVVPFLDKDGNVYQYLSINHDITQRKAAEEKIIQSERLLKKITSQVPGNTYMFEIEEDGRTNIHFVNRGTDTFNHNYSLEDLTEHPEIFREVLHDDDKAKFNDAMKEAYQTQALISFQYRIVVDGTIRWRWMQATSERDNKGKLIWYGATSDITPLIDYIISIEQIIYDISHVARRPISSMMGITKYILDSKLSKKEMMDLSKDLHLVSEEMDKFIQGLNTAYVRKRQTTSLKIDASSFIDKRDSLFN